MPYPMLHLVAESSLPRTFTAAGDLEELRMLRDAGYIRMELRESPPPGQAVVIEVTALGHMAIRHLGPSQPR